MNHFFLNLDFTTVTHLDCLKQLWRQLIETMSFFKSSQLSLFTNALNVSKIRIHGARLL